MAPTKMKLVLFLFAAYAVQTVVPEPEEGHTTPKMTTTTLIRARPTTTPKPPTTTPAGPTTTPKPPTTTPKPPTTTPAGPTTTPKPPTTTPAGPTTTPKPPTTTPAGPTTTPKPPTTTPAGPTTTPKPPTTTPAGPTTTPKPPTTTPAGPTTTPKPPTTTPAGPTTTPKPPTTTPAGPTTTPKPPTTTPAGPTTTPKPPTTTPAGPTTTPKPPTTTPAGPTTTPKPPTTTPAGPTTTPKPPTTTPAGPTTTPKPPTTTPAGPTTTPKPPTTTPAGPTTTPKPPTTTPAGPTTTPKPPTTTPAGPTTTPKQPTTTPKPQGICDRQPCPFGSRCEARANDTRVCLCMAGDSFNEESQSCQTAKVFPGQLQVPGITFEKNMTIKTSTIFQQTAKKITDQVDAVFKENPGYSHSIVLELKSIDDPKARANGGVSATVEMIFEKSAEINTTQIISTIAKASECDGCLLANSEFSKTKLCSKKPCDEKTSTCSEEDNGSFTCKCSKGYIMTDYSERSCSACPSGQTPRGTRECMNCPFGYSGFNCNESWKLILVIVGSVLGGLLVITVIALIVVAVKSPKKTSKRSKGLDARNTNMINVSDRDPLVTSLPTNHRDPPVKKEPAMGVKPFPNGGVPKIPRATAASAWDSGTNLEMTPSNSRQNLVNSGRSVSAQ
ncbi:mucin-13b isoform X4 [Corythoichthys intestinalis]|uniref:mucin-13b isoform X4 n=1 Tax=Corythoichthys intestinalis TaxID=161448 RepID=UPI0025A630CE|nr:mucin-13b isoform X4 [Corythoichthys intestinalis]